MTRPILALAAILALSSLATPSPVPLPAADAGQRGAPQLTSETITRVTEGSPAVWSDAQYPEPSRLPTRGAPSQSAGRTETSERLNPMPTPSAGIGSALYTGRASWYGARGDVAAVPWWRFGMDPVWASVCTFGDGSARCVSVLISDFCQCYVGTDRERVVDLSRNAFAQLADPSVGVIRVQMEVPIQRRPSVTLPPTSTEGSER